MAKTHAQIAARLKAKSTKAIALNELADRANGHQATRAQRAEAEAALVAEVGPWRTARLKESSLQRAGAKPKGLRGFFS